MNLRNLRPTQGVELVQLRKLIEGRGWRSALPEAFPDPVLLKLALAFRCVESSFTSGHDSHEEVPSLSAALYVVMSLLVQHPQRSGSANGVTLSETGMVHALQVYQWGLEREILTRITGFAAGGSSIVDGLLRCLDE